MFNEPLEPRRWCYGSYAKPVIMRVLPAVDVNNAIGRLPIALLRTGVIPLTIRISYLSKGGWST